jgi:hypothetical protein
MILSFHDLRAQYVLELSLLRFQWNQLVPALDRFEASMLAVAQLVEQSTVSVMLFDLHGLPSLGLDEQFWLAANWLPRVSVPALEQVAVVLPAGSLYNQMVVESLLRACRHFVHYEVQFFGETAEALDWLLHHQPVAQQTVEQAWQQALPGRS